MPTPDDDGQIAVRGEIMVPLSMCHAGWVDLRLRYELIGCAAGRWCLCLVVSLHIAILLRPLVSRRRAGLKGWLVRSVH